MAESNMEDVEGAAHASNVVVVVADYYHKHDAPQMQDVMEITF